MYRNPGHSLLNRSISGLMSTRVRPRDGDISGDFLKNPLRQEEATAGPVTPRIPKYPNASIEGSSLDSDLEFVASTKVRVRELEQEAEHLEKAFQNYQQRVSRCPAKSRLAARSPPLHLPPKGSQWPLKPSRDAPRRSGATVGGSTPGLKVPGHLETPSVIVSMATTMKHILGKSPAKRALGS